LRTCDIERLLFCVNPGRSGSHFLSAILSTSPGLCALHEPEHQFAKFAALKPSNWNLKSAHLSSTRGRRGQLKAEQILNSCESENAAFYAETNPMFATLWHDAVFDRFDQSEIVVVYLKRNPVDVIRSIYQLGWYQMRDGDQWMVSQFSVNSLFSPRSQEEEGGAIEKIIAHLINVELYGRKIREQCAARGAKIVELSSEKMFDDISETAEIFKSLSIQVDTARATAAASRNKESASKKYAAISRETCEEQLHRYLAKRPDLVGLLTL
jgi:hypothetical protein